VVGAKADTDAAKSVYKVETEPFDPEVWVLYPILGANTNPHPPVAKRRVA